MRKLKNLHLFILMVMAWTLNAQMEYRDFIYNGYGSGAMLDQASAVALSPNGENIYVMSSGDRAMSVYSRDAMTGELSFIENHRNGINDVFGLGISLSVIVSSDGKYVYAAGSLDNAIALFERNETNGTLKFIKSYKNDDPAISGLIGVQKVYLSPDGKNLYALGSDEDAMVVFTRDEMTGELTFLEVYNDGEDLNDFSYPLDIVSNSDGSYIYVTAYDADAVFVFSRNATDGSLTFVQKLFSSEGMMDGVVGAYAIGISPDDKYVYVTAPEEEAFFVFNRDDNDGKLSLMEKHVNGEKQ